ncbi:signal peptide peptidase SppA [Desertibacillus haloalkaliphilus]|uniref:signal peptide peptidase SppA n=1 Tax=Desertibacillus haloalkaliphilus TaxID=1328930 RepID=UPI001C279E9B|nr:signal peptide peptidase SppA [Desertibacillus haloalkaliphilus]MBU8905193.1 signal peptide peptidase SppA [Desertibacillus haloalkaliphilus]
MSRKRWIALFIALVLFVGSVAFNAVTMVAFGNLEGIFDPVDEGETFVESTIDRGNGRGKIAVLDVNGIIQEGVGTSILDPVSYRHRSFLAKLDHAAEDSSVEGMIIRINSPGGGVVESDEIHNKIVEIKEEYDKPIYVSMGSQAASGGYYISAPADRIVANSATITGSLGVIMQSVNVAELAEEFGIKIETIKSGPYKDIMSPTREVRDEERQLLQAMVDEMQDQFVQVIADGRDNLSEERVRELADGRIYSGSQAKELGLIDELGSLEDTIELLREDIGLGQLDVVRYESALGFGQLFTMSAAQFLPNQELFGLKQLVKESNSPTLMYLYTN